MDVKVFQKDDFTFDIDIAKGDLVPEEGLETAILISLFSDARVSDDEMPQGEFSKRGFWGDDLSPIDGDRTGSRLWLLGRRKRNLETLRLSEDYVREALQWLLDDGVATSVSTTAYYVGEETSGMWANDIVINRPTGESRYKVLWDKQLVLRG